MRRGFTIARARAWGAVLAASLLAAGLLATSQASAGTGFNAIPLVGSSLWFVTHEGAEEARIYDDVLGRDVARALAPIVEMRAAPLRPDVESGNSLSQAVGIFFPLPTDPGLSTAWIGLNGGAVVELTHLPANASDLDLVVMQTAFAAHIILYDRFNGHQVETLSFDRASGRIVRVIQPLAPGNSASRSPWQEVERDLGLMLSDWWPEYLQPSRARLLKSIDPEAPEEGFRQRPAIPRGLSVLRSAERLRGLRWPPSAAGGSGGADAFAPVAVPGAAPLLALTDQRPRSDYGLLFDSEPGDPDNVLEVREVDGGLVAQYFDGSRWSVEDVLGQGYRRIRRLDSNAIACAAFR